MLIPQCDLPTTNRCWILDIQEAQPFGPTDQEATGETRRVGQRTNALATWLVNFDSQKIFFQDSPHSVVWRAHFGMQVACGLMLIIPNL